MKLMLRRCLMRLMALLFGLGAVIVLALTAVQSVAFDRVRYANAYERYDRAAYIGIDSDELNRVTDHMLRYLQGEEDSLVLRAEIRGEDQQVFEERELLHMEDVKGLFNVGFAIRRWALIVVAIGLVLTLAMAKKRTLHMLSVGYLAALGVFLVLGIALGIAMAVDFNAAFIRFHELLFTNDLWLLDLNTDVLIQMFPEEFFNEMAVAILTWMMVAVLVPAAGAIVAEVRYRRQIRQDKA